MKTSNLLATAAAASMLLASSAIASSSNTLYIEQTGDSNTALVQQNAGTGGNDVGKIGAPVLQQGNLNSFSETQSTGGGFSRGNNDIWAVTQLGNSNSFSSNYSNNAGDNRIESLLQYGNNNYAAIGRNNQRSGVIGTIVQGDEATAAVGGNRNFLSISQTTSYLPGSQPAFTAGNSVLLVKQIGSNNGRSSVNDYNGGTQISQGGNGNVVQEAVIVGSNNNAAGSLWNTQVHLIKQRGLNNGDEHSIARTTGSGGNYIHVDQDGTSNQFDLQQGLSVASIGNRIDAGQIGAGNDVTGLQLGDYNTITSKQDGDGNYLNVVQDGDSNTATANVTGDYNGTGSFSGVAGSLASAKGLDNGTITQKGLSNTAFYEVLGSSNNKFAFSQVGDTNSITGSVSGVGGGNQAVVSQGGNMNTTSFSQAGGGNNLSVNQ
jgi:hypothetical protein